MSATTCGRCGTRLSSAGLGGLCPKCVAGAAFALDGLTPFAPEIEAAGPRRVHYFGDYELLHEIARGGMGVVYKARQVSLNRVVAVKMILSGALASEADVQRFRTEAEAAANLHHPNIVSIYEIGDDGGHHYFSMEFIEGINLSDLVREHPLPPRRAAELVKKVADSIEYAHQHGTLHRDLKPSNIIIDDAGEPHVTDFGLAKRIGGDSELTHSGQVLGTPSFMSPEQAAGRRAEMGAASDLYSLGAILYHLLTGRPPFAAETLEETLRQVMTLDPAPPRLLNAATPRDLETICLKCLEKDARRRYRSAQELVDELNRFLRGAPIHARPVSAAERALRWCRRHPAVAGLTLAVGLLLLAVAFTSTRAAWQVRQAHAAEQHQRLLQRVEESFAAGQPARALMGLGQLLRQNPDDRLAAQRLMFALAQEDIPIPLGVAWPHDTVVEAAQFSADGRRIVTLSSNVARVWDVESGQPLTPPLRHEENIRDTSFSPDGQRLLTLVTNAAQIWTVPGGGRLAAIQPGGRIRSARFSPDGRKVMVVDAMPLEGGVRAWDAETGQPITARYVEQLWPFDASVSADGNRFATAAYDYSLWVRNLRTGEVMSNRSAHRSFVYTAQFSPDGESIATASADGTARVWDARSVAALTPQMQHLGPARWAGFSPDGQHLASVDEGANVWLWNVWNELPLAGTLRHSARVRTLEFSPEGLRLLTVCDDNTVRVLDTRRGELLGGVLRFEERVLAAQFAQGAVRVVVASAGNTARVLEVHPGRPPGEPLRWIGSARSARFSADGRTVITTHTNGVVREWDACTGRRRLVPTNEFTKPSAAVAFSLLIADKSVRLLDPPTSQPLNGTFLHEAAVTHAELSPDAARLLTYCRVETGQSVVRGWELPTAPPGLAALAENLAGHRLKANGDWESVPAGEWRELQKRPPQEWGTNHGAQLARWFLRERTGVTTEAAWPRSVAEDVRLRVEENHLAGLQEAVRWSPTNASALAALARRWLAVPASQNPRHWNEADWFSRLALASAPEEPEVKKIRAEVADCPADLPMRNGGGASGVIDGQFYLTTPDDGYSGGARRFLHRYDPVRNTWHALTAPPLVHKSVACGVIAGRFYISGGGNGPTVLESDRLDVYDPASESWTTKAPMPTPRSS